MNEKTYDLKSKLYKIKNEKIKTFKQHNGKKNEMIFACKIYIL